MKLLICQKQRTKKKKKTHISNLTLNKQIQPEISYGACALNFTKMNDSNAFEYMCFV